MTAAIDSLTSHPSVEVRDATQAALQQADAEEEVAAAAVGACLQPAQRESAVADKTTTDEPSSAEESSLLRPPHSCVAVLVGHPRFEFSLACAAGMGLSQPDTTIAGLDVTCTFAQVLATFPAMGAAHLLGRIVATAPGGIATISLSIANVGSSSWSSETRLQLAAGEGYGLQTLHVGSVPPGVCVELVLQLLVSPAGANTQSLWALEDGSGEPFGPMLVLEVVRQLGA